MKNLTKLMNCYSKKKNNNNEIIDVRIQPKDLPEYQFQWLISDEDKTSEVFQEFREIIITSIPKRFVVECIPLNQLGIRPISEKIKCILMTIGKKLCTEVVENITSNQIAEYLKSNNHHKNLELHIQNLSRNLRDYYSGLALFIKLYYEESKRVGYDSYALTNEFCEEIINICIDVTYFDKGFCCDTMKRYNSLIFCKSRFAEIGLNESSDLLTVKRRKIESRLKGLNNNEQGVSHVDYLDNPVLRLSLLNCLGKIEKDIAELGKFDFNYEQFPSTFENIHLYLFEYGYINTSYEEFMSVLFHQRGTIEWKKEQYTIVQFIGFLYVHTEIVNDIQKGFISEFFCYPKTDDSLDSAYGKRIEFGKGKRKREGYLMLKPILNYIPNNYIRSKKL